MTGGGGGSFGPPLAPAAVDEPRDPKRLDKMFTDCGVAFLNGSDSPLLLPGGTGLVWTRGGGGRGGGSLRDDGASNGESSQLVVGVYLWGFPVALWGGGGAGAGRDGTDDEVFLCICNSKEAVY